MALHVKLDSLMLARLRQVERPVLQELGPVTRGKAAEILTASLPLVPVGEVHDPALPRLANTGFVDGPEQREDRASVTSTAGYAHPEAGAIHEGWHWGLKLINPPPHFLKKPARKGRSQFKRQVGATIMTALARLFPQK